MQRQARRNGLTPPLLIAAVLCWIAVVGWAVSAFLTNGVESKRPTSLSDVAKRKDASGSSVVSAVDKFEVAIHPGPTTPRIALRANGPGGGRQSVSVACSTCHSTRPADTSNKRPSDLNEFHQGLSFSHNNLSCLSCHNPDDYDSLHLADGTAVAYEDVMTLCAQCHGPQTRDYEHGAHGGMTGHWDLTRGPRTRNNCVDCHHPHTPAFPKMKPTFKPRDRFLDAVANDVEHDESLKTHE